MEFQYLDYVILYLHQLTKYHHIQFQLLYSLYNHYNNDFLDKVYPVGAVYISVNNTDPSTLFGGTWERITDGKFLRASGSSTTTGSTGGSNSHNHSTGNCTLTVNQIPSHSHEQAGVTYIYEPSGSWRSRVTSDNNGKQNINNNVSNKAWTLNTGGNQSHNHGDTGWSDNIPEYIAVSMWKRTA